MKLLSMLLLAIGLIACTKEEPKLSADVQNCIANDQNAMLVIFREKAATDLGAKLALQQACEGLVQELKKGK